MPDRPLGPPVTEPELYLILGVWGTRSPLGDVSRRVTMPHVANPAGNKLAPAGPTPEMAGAPLSTTHPMKGARNPSLHRGLSLPWTLPPKLESQTCLPTP